MDVLKELAFQLNPARVTVLLGEGLHNKTMPNVQMQQVSMRESDKIWTETDSLDSFWYGRYTSRPYLAAIWHSRTTWFGFHGGITGRAWHWNLCFLTTFQIGPPFLQHHDAVMTRLTRPQRDGLPLTPSESPSDLRRKALRYSLWAEPRLPRLFGIDALGDTRPSGFKARSKRLKMTNTNNDCPLQMEHSIETQLQTQITNPCIRID